MDPNSTEHRIQRNLERVDASTLSRRATSPRIADVTIRSVRSDFWASLQRNVAMMVARTSPESTRPVHDSAAQARNVFNAVAAFLAAHGDDDELLAGLERLGAGASGSMRPDDVAACAVAVGSLLASRSQYVQDATRADASDSPTEREEAHP